MAHNGNHRTGGGRSGRGPLRMLFGGRDGVQSTPLAAVFVPLLRQTHAARHQEPSARTRRAAALGWRDGPNAAEQRIFQVAGKAQRLPDNVTVMGTSHAWRRHHANWATLSSTGTPPDIA